MTHTLLNEIFAKDVQRPIEGVIKADDTAHLGTELDEYELDVLYPLESQNIVIDLDDGVKANYPKFGTALRRIPGLEASHD